MKTHARMNEINEENKRMNEKMEEGREGGREGKHTHKEKKEENGEEKKRTLVFMITLNLHLTIKCPISILYW